MNRTEAVTELISHIGSIKRSLQGQTYRCYDGSSLTSSQLGLLFAIKHHGPISAQDLAEKLSLTPGAVSQIVEGLQAGDYIVRAPRLDSRRTFDLTLSPAGAKKVVAIEHERHAIINQTTADLSDAELQTFVTLMQKILRALQNETKPVNTETNKQ